MRRETPEPRAQIRACALLKASARPSATAKGWPRLPAKCKAPSDDDATFCDACGASIVAARVCACGATSVHDARFCKQCGRSFEVAAHVSEAYSERSSGASNRDHRRRAPTQVRGVRYQEPRRCVQVQQLRQPVPVTASREAHVNLQRARLAGMGKKGRVDSRRRV